MTKPKFAAFVKNKESAKVIGELIEQRGYDKTVLTAGNIRDAVEKLAGQPTPEFIVVELADKTHDSAFSDLDKLANICDPGTQVVVVGDIDELSFYKQLITMGITEYLLTPIKIHQLDRATTSKTEEQKASAVVTEKKECKVISVIGTRGGVGASTFAVNLAEIFASNKCKTVIVDMNPDFGTIPLMLDVEASKGLVEALEKPERVDNLFLERVLVKVTDSLYVMGAEKNLADPHNVSEKAGQTILGLLKSKFEFIIFDLPWAYTWTHNVLNSSEVIVVTELSIPGLRDTMRIVDLVEKLGNKRIYVVANKTGINKKFETAVADFEKGLGRKLDSQVPFEAEVYGYSNAGKVLVSDLKTSKFAAGINAIASKFIKVDGAAAAQPSKKPAIFDKILKKK